MPPLKIEVHPEVYSELEQSRAWYERRARNLGKKFIEEIERAIAFVYETPERWPFYDSDEGLRRFLVHRFPYALIYRLTPAAIQIIAVMHLRRNPGYWKDRFLSGP